MRRAAFALAVGGLAGALALAGQSPSPQIPINHAPLVYTLPRPVEATLNNGLRVLILENHRLPTVDLAIEIHGAGGFDEPADRPGLAVFTAQMMNLGTQSRSSDQLAAQLADLGAHASVSSGYGVRTAVVSASGLSANFAQWFALATDMLLHPSFSPDEWKHLEAQAEAQLRQQTSSPAFLLNYHAAQAVYGKFPAAVTTTTPAALRAMTPQQFRAWHDQRYVPQNAILAIAGDVHAQTLIPQLNQRLAAWRRTSFAPAAAGDPAAPAARRVILVDRPGSVQTTLAMENLGIERTSPDFFAMAVLNEVLGAVPQGRLFTDLRSRQSLAYNVGGGFSAGEFAGIWRANGDFRTEVTAQAAQAMLAEIDRLRKEPVPADELGRAQRALIVRQAIALEQPDAVLSDWLASADYHFPADYWDRYAARIRAVTAADLQRVAQKYYDPARLQIIAVGDAAKIKAVLGLYGDVEVFHADGTRG